MVSGRRSTSTVRAIVTLQGIGVMLTLRATGEQPCLAADGTGVFLLSKEPVPACAIARSPFLQHLQAMQGHHRVQLHFQSVDVRAWAEQWAHRSAPLSLGVLEGETSLRAHTRLLAIAEFFQDNALTVQLEKALSAAFLCAWTAAAADAPARLAAAQVFQDELAPAQRQALLRRSLETSTLAQHLDVVPAPVRHALLQAYMQLCAERSGGAAPGSSDGSRGSSESQACLDLSLDLFASRDLAQLEHATNCTHWQARHSRALAAELPSLRISRCMMAIQGNVTRGTIPLVAALSCQPALTHVEIEWWLTDRVPDTAAVALARALPGLPQLRHLSVPDMIGRRDSESSKPPSDALAAGLRHASALTYLDISGASWQLTTALADAISQLRGLQCLHTGNSDVACAVAYLPALQALHISGRYPAHCAEQSIMQTAQHLPALTRLQVQTCADGLNQLHYDAAHTGLRHLELLECSVNEDFPPFPSDTECEPQAAPGRMCAHGPAALALLTALTYLNLDFDDGWDLDSGDACRAIAAAVASLPRLQHFEINVASAAPPGAFANTWSHAPALESLDAVLAEPCSLFGTTPDSAVRLRHLTTLTLNIAPESREAFANVSHAEVPYRMWPLHDDLAQLTRLCTLSVMCTAPAEEMAAFDCSMLVSALTALQQLSSLELQCAWLGADGSKALARIAQMPALLALECMACEVKAAFLKQVVLSELTRLRFQGCTGGSDAACLKQFCKHNSQCKLQVLSMKPNGMRMDFKGLANLLEWARGCDVREIEVMADRPAQEGARKFNAEHRGRKVCRCY